jgi:hypothetical protein
MLIGALLAVLSVLIISAVLVDFLQRTQFQNGLIAIGILVGLLWLLWTRLPDWLREMIRRSMRRKEPRNGR